MTAPQPAGTSPSLRTNMSYRGDLSEFLPTPHQEQLLKACLFEGEEALAAWQRWRSGADLDQIDGGSVRLLPLLAEKLRRLNVHDPAFDKYRGVQRRTWARNNLLYRAAGRVVRQFNAERIPVMALKGFVLASAYYDEMSLRPMNDIDLLVHLEDVGKAIGLLERSGQWTRTGDVIRLSEPADFAIQPSSGFVFEMNPEIEIDLHWRLFQAWSSQEADAALWERSGPFDVAATSCLAPSPADMLLHTCAHGMRWNSLPTLRWVVDATMLTRRTAVDWAYLSDQAKRRGLSLGLAEAFAYLRDVFRVPIPNTATERLERVRSRPIERQFYKWELRPRSRQPLLVALRVHCHIARRELVRLHGFRGYWQYFGALRRGRGLREIALWIRQRLASGVYS